MNQIASVALLAWPVVALALFAAMRPWKAAIATFFGAYVLLPSYAEIPLPGLPDYSKYTAAGFGALLGVLLFDAGRLLSFRPRWYDLGMLTFCLVPAVSIVTNGLPTWDAVSAVSEMVLPWGIPYFIGRLYAAEAGAARDLALGLSMAAAATAPLIAFEILTKQSLNGIAYGRSVYNGMKYGIYSPVVFTANQLELGHWMALAATPSFALWCTRAGPPLGGRPFGAWAIVAIGGALLCHQTAAAGMMMMMIFVFAATAGRRRLGTIVESSAFGGLLLVAPKLGGRMTLTTLLGLGLFRYFRDRRPQWIVWILIVSAPLFVAIRVTDAVPRNTISVVAYVFSAERGESLNFRMRQEDRMKVHVMRRPLFGWGTFQGDRGWAGGVSIVDSFWIIHFARYGVVGLASLYVIYGLAQGRAALRFPISGWADPRAAPVGALILCLAISVFDGLLNAYQAIPAVPLAIGLLIALPAGRGASAGSSRIETPSDERLDRVDRLRAVGRAAEAETACRLIVSARSTDPGGGGPLADACDRLADLLEADGRLAEAEPHRRRALELRAAMLAEVPSDPAARLAMAACYERLARNLTARGGRSGSAVAARVRSLELRAAILADDPDDPDERLAYADGLNDLAWLLAVLAEPLDRDPRRAAKLAEQAVRIDPGRKAYWNTLGASYVAAGEPGSAVSALNHSLRFGPDPDGYDDALLALAFAGLGDPAAARAATNRLDARLASRRDAPPSLLRLRSEAAAALRTLAAPAPR